MQTESVDPHEEIVFCKRCGFERGRFTPFVGCILPPPGRDIPRQCQRCGYEDKHIGLMIVVGGILLGCLLIPVAFVVLKIYVAHRR